MIYGFLPVIGWKPSKMTVKVSIRFASTINGVFASYGKTEMHALLRLSTITDILLYGKRINSTKYLR